MTDSNIQFLDWPAPDNIKACFTYRTPGFSSGRFSGFNLARHVDDSADSVNQNRQQLLETTNKPICWLSQTHSTIVLEANQLNTGREADASWSRSKNFVAAVMTADCLPVFFCDTSGDQVAVAHAGWRGLLSGIIEQTLKTFNAPAGKIMVFLGPAIGPGAFEVGDDVRDMFLSESSENTDCFTPGNQDHKWMADIYMLARYRLARQGIQNIYGGTFCTYSESEKFFSYRRDGITGRMANLIWKL